MAGDQNSSQRHGLDKLVEVIDQCAGVFDDDSSKVVAGRGDDGKVVCGDGVRDGGGEGSEEVMTIDAVEVKRRKRGRPLRTLGTKSSARKKTKDEEDVCFICFDGGDLVLCDRWSCPKAYHPACIRRDAAFFQTKAKWDCGWHVCNVCKKNSSYMCYTCTYSLCKKCTKDVTDYVSLRGNKGLCGVCMKTVMLIENHGQGSQEMVDFDDKNSWEYLFKIYWTRLKEKLSLTLDELIHAKNPSKEDAGLRQKGASPGMPKSGIYDNGLHASNSKRRKTSKQPKVLNGGVTISAGNNCLPQSTRTDQFIDNRELNKLWHYQDPAGKIQGPFSMSLLQKWSVSGHFPPDLRIWRIDENQDRSVLLTDALQGQYKKEPCNVTGYDGQPSNCHAVEKDNKHVGSSELSTQYQTGVKCNGFHELLRSCEMASRDVNGTSNNNDSSTVSVQKESVSLEGNQQLKDDMGHDTSNNNDGSTVAVRKESVTFEGNQALKDDTGHECHDYNGSVRSNGGDSQSCSRSTITDVAHLSEQHIGSNGGREDEEYRPGQRNASRNPSDTPNSPINCGCSSGKQSDSEDYSSESSEQNWRPPYVVSPLEVWDTRSDLPSVANTGESSEKNHQVESPEVPSPKQKPSSECLNTQDMGSEQHISCIAMQDASPRQSAGSSVPSVANSGESPVKNRQVGHPEVPSPTQNSSSECLNDQDTKSKPRDSYIAIQDADPRQSACSGVPFFANSAESPEKNCQVEYPETLSPTQKPTSECMNDQETKSKQHDSCMAIQDAGPRQSTCSSVPSVANSGESAEKNCQVEYPKSPTQKPTSECMIDEETESKQDDSCVAIQDAGPRQSACSSVPSVANSGESPERNCQVEYPEALSPTKKPTSECMNDEETESKQDDSCIAIRDAGPRQSARSSVPSISNLGECPERNCQVKYPEALSPTQKPTGECINDQETESKQQDSCTAIQDAGPRQSVCSGVPSVANSGESPEKNRQVEFPEVPSPTQKPSSECFSGQDTDTGSKQQVSDIAIQDAGLRQSDLGECSPTLDKPTEYFNSSLDTSLAWGPAEVAAEHATAPTAVRDQEKPTEYFDLSIVSSSAFGAAGEAGDHATTPTTGGSQQRHHYPSYPASNPSTCQQVVCEPNEIYSFIEAVEESVSDLLAEAEAMATRNANDPGTPTSTMYFDGDFTEGSINDCFSDVLDPGRSDILSFTGNIQLHSQSTVTHDMLFQSNAFDPLVPNKGFGGHCSQSNEVERDARNSEVSVNQFETIYGAHPSPPSMEEGDTTNTSCRLGSEGIVSGQGPAQENSSMGERTQGNGAAIWGTSQGALQEKLNVDGGDEDTSNTNASCRLGSEGKLGRQGPVQENANMSQVEIAQSNEFEIWETSPGTSQENLDVDWDFILAEPDIWGSQKGYNGARSDSDDGGNFGDGSSR